MYVQAMHVYRLAHAPIHVFPAHASLISAHVSLIFIRKVLYVLLTNECGAMNEWITIDKCFPPPHMCLHIIHNRIFYLTEIYRIGNQPPGVGPRPSMVVPYGIAFGADTIHPALFHNVLASRKPSWVVRCMVAQNVLVPY